ncbi:hypothetical protein BX666DRAFT_1855276 [Dichotomocladium elegans]|nr:hypothetical protein BX666DRAFT_1855276 [Dichotomocladium elegans]
MLGKYLKVNCTNKIRDALALPNVKCLKRWVVPGTMAETMLDSIDKFTETKAGKAALTKFYKEAGTFKHSGIKQKAAKTTIKASMMQEVAHDEEERVQKKRRTGIDADVLSSGDRAVAIECGDSEDDMVSAADRKKRTGDIWKDWKCFLEEAANTQHLPALSPEKHGVVWYGPGVRRRLSLPEDLYACMKYAIPSARQLTISSSFKEAVKNIIQSDNRHVMVELIESFRMIKGDAVEKKFLIDMFSLFAEQIYDDLGSTLSDSEACLNGNLVKPSLQICTRMLRRQEYDVTYFPGEIELESMTEQLSSQGLLDHRFKYNADGKIRIHRDRIEPLLLEVSSAYKQASQDKIAFDHSKAMFGLLSILKTIACRYQYGSFEYFRMIKVHFLHVYGSIITAFEIYN